MHSAGSELDDIPKRGGVCKARSNSYSICVIADEEKAGANENENDVVECITTR